MNKIGNIDINKPLDLAEKASEFLYQARARIYAAKILLETPDSYFEKQAFKQDCLHYQIDDVYELLKGYESFFDDVITDIFQHRRDGSVESSIEPSD